MHDYDRDDPGFVADLHKSQESVWAVARWLGTLGHHVTIRALRIRPAAEQMGEFADDGDIEIVQRVEVKARRLDFTSADDYPFPTIIVDVAHTWDNATPKPLAYVILNRAGTHAAIVYGQTSPKWVKTERFDAGKNRTRTFYESPVSLAKFFQLERREV
jgi:hypothetical protein